MNSSNYPKSVRISLIIAILAGLTVGGLNVIKVKEKIRHLQSALAEQTVARQRAEGELAAARQELTTTVATLTQTKTTLQAVTAEKESALVSATDQKKRAEKLDSDLAISRREGDVARTELARYRAAGMEPEQIVHAATHLKTLQSELDTTQAENKGLHNQIQALASRLPDEGRMVILPAGLNGKVLVSDPKWDFVVLDAGENQGVLKWGELLVSRSGKLVSKVVVTKVEPDRCVATVVPGWRLGEIAEGDRVIPANPGS